MTAYPPAPRLTANPSPLRHPRSIRRTTSIDVTWPNGPEGERRMEGRSRDVLRSGTGEDRLRAEAQMVAMIGMDRTIDAIIANPAPAAIGKLVGERGGGHLRLVLRDVMPELIAQGSPLYLLLDDISGTSLVSQWAISQWYPGWQERMRALLESASPEVSAFANRTDVCWGFRQGSTALEDVELRVKTDEAASGGELRNPADPEGWHEFPVSEGMAFRRARRIDVWREPGADGAIRIEAAFQDSAPRPAGDRAALHEYIVHVTADPQTLQITALDPEPRVLPFWECPGAIPNAKKLIGTALPDMRTAVHDSLRGPVGCTHLNDALRSLAEVPALLGFLDQALAD